MQSMKTSDTKVQKSICKFMNMVCGSDVDDVSSLESQCECLLKVIVVCLFILLEISLLLFIVRNIYSSRMEIKMISGTGLV